VPEEGGSVGGVGVVAVGVMDGHSIRSRYLLLHLRNAQASNLERIATDEERDAQEDLKGADGKEVLLTKSGEGQSCPHPVVPECQRSN